MGGTRTASKLLQFGALSRLARDFHPFRGKIAVVIILGMVISAVQPVALKLTSRIIDELPNGFTTDFFRTIPWLLIGLFVISGLAKYFHNTLRRQVGERVVLELRSKLFSKYLSFPLPVLDKRPAGDLLSAIQNDLQQINQGMETVCDLLREPLTFAALMGFAFYTNWRLTLAMLIVAPLVTYLFSRSGAAVKRYTSRNLLQLSYLLSLSQESLVGARVVKAFTLEETLESKFKQIQDHYFRTLWKSIRVQELATPLVELVGAVVVAGIVVFVAYQAEQKMISQGDFVGFLGAIGLLQMPIKKLNNAYLKIKVAEAAAERVYELLDTPLNFPAVHTPSGSVAARFESEIRFENVGLCYEDRVVLQDISFSARRGECVALAGPSGSGKTSIVCLLPRLYEVSQGRITFDGVDIRTFDLRELRSLISVVTQDVFLFNDTIYENIRYGRPGASRQEVERAARLAHCEEFIQRAPKGFDTRIGDRGVCLSGGERQRVAIARAILRAAPILILDEATSNLDSHSERMVQEALDELLLGKTSFLVAHRLGTIRHADKILVIDAGQIRESGSHEQLLCQKGIYSGLVGSQLWPQQV